MSYKNLIKADGYYCDHCNTYHSNANMKHRYTFETIGEWCGQPAKEFHHEVYCPECGHDTDLETFDYMLWSHLKAYEYAEDVRMAFRYPLFDRTTNGPTYAYEKTYSSDRVEAEADHYCIEVIEIAEKGGEIIVTVEFQ